MRRIMFFLIFLLFIPTFVFAEDCRLDGVTIQSIELIDKSEGTIELTKANGKDTVLNMDLFFSKVNDYIKYKVTIKNNTDVDYVLDESMFNKSYDYLKYTFETDNKTVKANQTRELVLSATLINTPTTGVFNEINTFNLNLTGGKIENPPTGIMSLLYYLPIIVIIGLIVTFTIKKNKTFKAMVLIIGLLVSVPFIVKALCKCNLTIKSKVVVDNCKYRLVTGNSSFSPDSNDKELCLGVGDVTLLENINYKYLHDYSWSYDTNATYAFLELTDDRYSLLHPIYNNNSYVKVYSDAAKTNLIKTFTKTDFLPHYYFISRDKYADYKIILPVGEYEKLYYELSPDIEEHIEVRTKYGIMDYYRADDPSNYSWRDLAPIIVNSDIVAKIEYLKEHARNGTLVYFTNCKELINTDISLISEGASLTCEGNTYYAVWSYK